MRSNKNLFGLLAGVGTGAALMYFLDPVAGNRRRSMIRDKAVSLSNNAGRAINKRSKDISNKVQGAMAKTKKAMSGKTQADGLQTEQPATV